MKNKVSISLLAFVCIASSFQINAQDQYSLAFGAGYYGPIMSYQDVVYDNATFNPEFGLGFSYFLSFDYKLNENLLLGVGFNGAYAQADYIQNAEVNNEVVEGYLDAGAVACTHLLVNLSYYGSGESIKPYAKLGIGYFVEQAELGDVPLRLTDNVETEIFTDFKYAGIGILPELGASYQDFSLSAGYSLALGEMEGEKVKGGFQSPGTMNLSGIQINLTYRIDLF